ncbi:MFS transporter [Leucobacter sp. wl10]|nr:MFS transporter [Leucobacter sp. wl10]
MGLTVWFSATAVLSALRTELGIGQLAAVWLTASVQIGFVTGGIVSSLLTLGDRFEPQRIMGLSAFGAGVTTASLALVPLEFWGAIATRFLTGVFLAGLYPMGMKVMASWASSKERGTAFGLLLGALTLGSGMPHLLTGLADALPWRGVLLIASGITIAAGVIALTGLRSGPHTSSLQSVPRIRHAWAGFRSRGPLLANLGYFGHMWELYAFWTWLPTFLLASRKAAGEPSSAAGIGVTTFLAIGVAGVAGCLIGGWLADRFGRRLAAVSALAVSGASCLISPVMFAVTGPAMIVFLVIWGSSVIADSGVFSTSLSESVDPRYVGTALTAQTTIGFLITVVTIQLVPLVAQAFGWQYAFLVLAIGPVVGGVAMFMRRDPRPLALASLERGAA